MIIQCFEVVCQGCAIHPDNGSASSCARLCIQLYQKSNLRSVWMPKLSESQSHSKNQPCYLFSLFIFHLRPWSEMRNWQKQSWLINRLIFCSLPFICGFASTTHTKPLPNWLAPLFQHFCFQHHRCYHHLFRLNVSIWLICVVWLIRLADKKEFLFEFTII